MPDRRADLRYRAVLVGNSSRWTEFHAPRKPGPPSRAQTV